MLLDLVAMAVAQRSDEYLALLQRLRTRHFDTIRALLPEPAWAGLEAAITSDVKDIQDVLRAVCITRGGDERTREIISGYGEVWSAQILTAYMNSRGFPFVFMDARKVLVVSDSRNPKVRVSVCPLQPQALSRPCIHAPRFPVAGRCRPRSSGGRRVSVLTLSVPLTAMRHWSSRASFAPLRTAWRAR